MIAWNETADFYRRSLTVEKKENIFIESREYDIPQNVSQGLAALGVTYESDFYEYTQLMAREGLRAGNLVVLAELPFCFQVISAVGSVNTNCCSQRNVLVSPSVYRIADLVLGALKDAFTKTESYSIPQELAYLGGGILGVDKIVPKNEFEGDVGEDGRPYDHYTLLGVYALKTIVLDGKKYTLNQVLNKPIMIGNADLVERDEVKDAIAKFDWLISTRSQKEWKSIRIQTGRGEARVKSYDPDVLSEIINTNYELIVENSRSVGYNAGKLVGLINFAGQDSVKSVQTMLQLHGFYPVNIDLSGRLKKSSLSRNLGKLSREGFRFVIFLGPKELEKDGVTLKDLDYKTQEFVKIGTLHATLRSKLVKPGMPKRKQLLLMQEPGYTGHERRAFEPSKDYVREVYGIDISVSPAPKADEDENIRIVKVNHSDLPRLLLDGRANEAILGYNRLADYLALRGLLQEIVSVDEFNSYAEKNGIPLRIRNLGKLECDVALAIPIWMKELPEDEVMRGELCSEYLGIAKLIAHEFPALTSRKIQGCAEVYPTIILDVVSSGRTLQANAKEVLRRVLKSYVVVVKSVRQEMPDQFAGSSNS